MELPSYAKCVLNPFDEPACGYPDVFNKPTMKVKLVETYTLSSDATGFVARSASPTLVRSWYTFALSTGNFAAGTYVSHPDYSSVAAQGTWARTVCMGVNVEYIGPVSTGSGTLSVMTDPAENYWQGVTPESCMDDGYTGPALEGRKVALVPSMPARYEGEAGVFFSCPTFDYVYILATGLPASTACFRVTVVRHVEILPTKANALARSAATHTPGDGLALTALSNVALVQAPPKSWKQELALQTRHAIGAIYQAVKPGLKIAGEAALGAALGGLI
jgi:hypothetical protein